MRITDYWQLREEIKKGDIKNSYLLAGENDFIKEEIIDLLETSLVEKKSRAFDETKFYGDELPDDIYRHICSPPVASKRHLSVIFGIDRIKKGNEQIKRVVESLSPFLCIVLTAGKIDKKKENKFIKWVLDNVYTLVCEKFSEDEVKRWILETVKSKGADISRDAICLLWDFSGDDMLSLHSEIEKLLTFKPKGAIETKDIKAIVGEDRILSIYTLEQAIYESDLRKGMKALENLFMWGEKPTVIVYRLRIWLSSSLSGKGWKNSLGFDDAAMAISMLMETELSIKRGEMDGRFAVEELVYKLINRR
ncbi:MAG: DNA polymerase III subunit delta [bacterium (Candidatus Stahlbacteria) CG08_land_8_20_14_0_20_40_26]|nr:MAG: DNA polymerase III subunit delta [bacterium (Candidatus Stahlbacteria) CG08_land_8_20_14_0_20_40_26]